MSNYWEERYKLNGNSGLGSYGKIADHKAQIINDYIIKNNIKTISDFGCGDGNQISLLKTYELYHGFDVSPYIVDSCINKFKGIGNMFFYKNINDLPTSELCLSLDVLYHIIDFNEFEKYLRLLFEKSSKHVIIFSSNHSRNDSSAPHIIHRKFTEWINKNISNYALIEEGDKFENTSAKFYTYLKK